MSKKDIFKVCLVAAVVASSSAAYANTKIDGSTIIGGGTYSPSNKVVINVMATADAYAAKSGHSNGDRTIFTSNTDPKLYWNTKSTGTEPAVVTSATETVSNWTTL